MGVTKPLHTLEKRILKTLKIINEGLIEDIAKEANLSLDQTRRAVEWLKAKGMVETQVEQKKMFFLDTEGKKTVKEGLP